MNDPQTFEDVLQASGCIGPYDEVHRCSALHCGHCGVCDVMPQILAIHNSEVAKTLEAFTQDLKDELDLDNLRKQANGLFTPIANAVEADIAKVIAKYKEQQS